MRLIVFLKRWVFPAAAAIVLSSICHAFAFLNAPWYESLGKPVFMPSPVVLYFAWAVATSFALYVLSFIISKDQEDQTDIKQTYCAVFAMCGSLNALACYIFFDRGKFQPAIWILVLCIALAILIKRKITKSIGSQSRFLLPYIMVLAAQTFLCYCIAMIN